MQIIRHSADKDVRFIKEAVSLISIKTELQHCTAEEAKLRIAENMLQVAKFSESIGFKMNLSGLKGLTVTDEFPEGIKYSTGFYIEGNITIRSDFYSPNNSLAHEMFHMYQDINYNMPYSNHLQQSYTEGGACLFAAVYTFWLNNQKAPLPERLILKGQEVNYKEAVSEFKTLKRSERTGMLALILGNMRDSPDHHAKYDDGKNFVSLALAINNLNIVHTLNMLLKSSPYAAIHKLRCTGKSSLERMISLLPWNYPTQDRLQKCKVQTAKPVLAAVFQITNTQT